MGGFFRHPALAAAECRFTAAEQAQFAAAAAFVAAEETPLFQNLVGNPENCKILGGTPNPLVKKCGLQAVIVACGLML